MVGVMSLAASYIYKLVHLLVYRSNGVGYPFMNTLYVLTKTISESLVVGLLVTIASGWSVIHSDDIQKRRYLSFSVILGVWNALAAVLATWTDSHLNKYHFYDCWEGFVILFVRSLILLLFLSKIASTYEAAKSLTKKFVKDFAVLGFIYIAAYPLAVIFCELFLPIYKQHEGVVAMTEVAHVLANGLLTYMVTSRRSAYRVLEHANTTFLTPMEAKFS